MIVSNVWVVSLPEREDRRFRLTTSWPYKDVKLNFFEATRDAENPAAGCTQSHLNLLRTLDEPTLILEDDAVFSENFTLTLYPPADWQVLWLGRQFLNPVTSVDDTWARSTRMLRTHAYVTLDPKFIARSLRQVTIKYFDLSLSQVSVPQYTLRVATVGQRAGKSDISGFVRKKDMYWNDR